MKRLVLVVVSMLALAGTSVFAQNKTSLNITCNQVGAQVYINGKLAGTTTPNFSFLVPRGKIQVRVQKNGFRTFETVVVAAGSPLNLNVRLEPIGGVTPAPVTPPPVIVQPQIIQHSITINCNVQGADVIINGNPAGKTPFRSQVPAGSYSVLVRAPGYFDFTQNVVVNGPTQVNAMLQGMSYQLSVDSPNFRGAQVLVNGSPVGQTPFIGMLQPGSYSIVVQAPGFNDFAAAVTMNGPQNIVAVLQPAAASWQVVLPDAYVNKDLKGGHWSQIQIFVDGALQKTPAGQVVAGRHNIRVVAGGFAVETAIDFQPGRAYTFEPILSLNVK